LVVDTAERTPEAVMREIGDGLSRLETDRAKTRPDGGGPP
jgi:hypothetical protein